MKLWQYIAVLIGLVGAIPNYAFAGAKTSLQWGVDRTVTPWYICAYDSNNVCQNIIELPSTGGGAYIPPASGGVYGLTGILQGNGTSAPTAIVPGTGVVTALGYAFGSVNGAGNASSAYTISGGTTASSAIQRAGRTVSLVDDFGAYCDVITIHDLAGNDTYVSSTATSNTVTFSGANSPFFVTADVGKYIVIAGINTGNAALASTITAVNSSASITIATPAVVTTSNRATAIWYGHDDTTALTQAVTALPIGGSIILPRGTCGFASAYTLPSIITTFYPAGKLNFVGQGRDTTQLVALGPAMDAIFIEPTTFHQQASFLNLTLNATGVATYAYDALGGYGAMANYTSFNNGLTASVRFGDGVHNCQNGYFDSIYYNNDSTLFPGTPSMPTYNLLVRGTDTHFTDNDANGALTANFYDFGADNVYTAAHGYGPAQYVFWFNYLTTCIGCVVDGATVAGVKFDAGGGNIYTGGRMFFNSQSITGVYGFAFASGTGRNQVSAVQISSLPNSQFIDRLGSANGTNNIYLNGIDGSVFGLPSSNTLIATTTDAATPTVLSLDGFAPTTSTSIPLNNFSYAQITGTLIARDGTTGFGQSWSVSALVNVGAPGNAPFVTPSPSITPLFTNGSITFAVAPTLTASNSTLNTFLITVQGISTDVIHWSFTPTITGAN